MSGCIIAAEDNLMVLLADCAVFRTLVGAADQAEALSKIYRAALPAPASYADGYTRAEMEAYRPFAIVGTAGRNGIRRTSIAQGQFDTTGNLVLEIEQDVQVGSESESAAYDYFQTILGDLIDELCAKSGQAVEYTYLNINTLDLDGPRRVKPSEEHNLGDFLSAALNINYSGGA